MNRKKIQIIAATLITLNTMNTMVYATEKTDEVKKESVEIQSEAKKEESSKTNAERVNKEKRTIKDLGLNNKVSGTIEGMGDDYYKIKVVKSGKLSLKLESFGKNKIMYLLDKNMNQINLITVDAGKKGEKFTYLAPGEYYIKVGNYVVPNGAYSYNLESSFTEVPSEDKEPNDGMVQAQKLEFNKPIKGFLAYDDKLDTFKIDVKKSGELKVKCKALANLRFELLDEAGNKISYTNLKGTEKNPREGSVVYGLNSGTYYIKVLNNNILVDLGGSYTLLSSFEEANNNDIEPNESIYKANKIPFDTTMKGFLAWADNTDVFKFNLNDKTNLELNVQTFFNQRLCLIDEKGKEYSVIYINADKNDPKKETRKILLEKGTYYIKVEKHIYANYGAYNLNIKTKHFKDTDGHWAEREIENFANKGYIDTTKEIFNPNKAITRAEFIKLVNKVFGYKNYKNVEKFTDVNNKYWFFNEINAALNAGYITSKNATFRPNEPITREEVANIITSIKKCKDSNLDKLNKYSDKDKVSIWAKSSVEGAIEKGYMGQGSKTFRPKDNITRGESVVTLNRVANSK